MQLESQGRRSPGRADVLLQHLLETVTVVDASFRAVYTTGDEVGALGYERGTMAGRVAFDYLHPDDHDRAREALVRCLARPGERVLVPDVRLRHADGSFQWVEAQLTNLLDHPAVRGVVVASRNVTDRVEAREALRHSEQRFRRLVQHAADLVTVLDADGQILEVTPAAGAILGVPPGDLLGGTYDLFPHPEDRAVARSAFFQALRTTTPVDFALRVQRPDGAVRHVEATITNLLDDPAVAGLVVNAHDVTERVRAEAALAHQALHDPLTGLPNRALLADRLEHALARRRRSGTGVALLFCDLDRFKVVNDSLGHDAGDDLLVEVGSRLNASVRSEDTVARIGTTVSRLGGDEFVVVCEDFTRRDDVEHLAERLLAVVAEPMELRGGPVVVTASIGIAVAGPNEDAAATELLRDADAAMYLAKERGKARYEIFDRELRARTLGRLTLERELRRAIPAGELRLRYQPSVDLVTGEVLGVEALLRWQHPSRGLLAPSEFLEVAEETGMVVALGHWVVEEAQREASRWPHRPGGLRIWINLSPHQLADGGLLGRLERSAATGEPALRLGVEITEGTLLADVASAQRSLSRLHEAGILVALDDFGTGYSSLAYLQRFPVDVVKIDRSFVAGLGGPGGAPLVAAIVAMADALDLTVVAEGVETERQRAELLRLGCSVAQGYLLAPPVAAHEVGTLLP